MTRAKPIGRRMIRVLARADLELALVLAMLATAAIAAGATWALRALG